jgi:hypothetical protein
MPVSASLLARAASWAAWSWTWATRSDMRATTSRNSTIEPSPSGTQSIGRWRAPWYSSRVGAIRAAGAVTSRRPRVTRAPRAGATSDTERIDGCSAAAPQHR